jgi:outer membrane protein assembly factor BamA
VIAAAVIVLAVTAGDMTSGVNPRWQFNHGLTPEVVSQPEIIAEVRVHGNLITPEDEILKIAGIVVGAPLEPGAIEQFKARLDRDGRFQDVQVLKRFASIADPTRIALVVIANEGAVRLRIPAIDDAPIQVERRRGLRTLMWLPILDFEDGYGATFGVRFAFVGVGGERGRVSLPLTWGGQRRAGVEFDRVFDRGPLSRIDVGTSIDQRENPAFEIDDTRKRLWARAERAMGPVRAGVSTGWQRVSFGDRRDDLRTIGADVSFDTRLDTVLPRNAVFATAAWERVDVDAGGVLNRLRLDGRGYLGLVGQSVLVGRVLRDDVDRPAPLYLRSLLGGWSNLRGFEAGAFHGDTLLAGSLEVRVPLSPVLSQGKLGVSVFVDAGAAYDKGQRLDEATLRTGGGGSVWATVLAFRMGVSVAHGRGAGTRVNFGGGLTF